MKEQKKLCLLSEKIRSNLKTTLRVLIFAGTNFREFREFRDFLKT